MYLPSPPRWERDLTNVTPASTTTRSGDAAPQVVEALRKAGVTDLPSVSTSKAELNKITEGSGTLSMSSAEPLGIKQAMKQAAEPPRNDEPGVFRSLQTKDFEMFARASNDENTIGTPKKHIFDTSGWAEAVNPSSTKNTSITISEASPLAIPDRDTNGDIHKTSETTADTTAESSPPVIPMDESPEDAALRRQMIQYGLHEVGAVVAELDLDDETESQLSYSDDDLDGDEQHTSSTDEEEDAFGRTTRRVVDDDYRRQMLELEKKLNIKGAEKSQPKVQNRLAESDKMAVEQTSNKPFTSVLVDKSQKSTVKKGVRFAEELDISPVPAIPPRSTGTSDVTLTMQDSVVERAVPKMELKETTSPMPKKSRFKMAREAAQLQEKAPATATQKTHIPNGALSGSIRERASPNAAPSVPLMPAIRSKQVDVTSPPKAPSEEERTPDPEGPPGKTHASTIIEREVSSNAVDAPDPDDMDPDLLRQEVAVEYHRMRNRMIQREGGFLPHDDQEERVPLTEEEGGSGKKMSRFKAARLRGHV